MTRDEAEEVIMAVEVGFGDRYGITRGQYAEAMLIVLDDVAEQKGGWYGSLVSC